MSARCIACRRYLAAGETGAMCTACRTSADARPDPLADELQRRLQLSRRHARFVAALARQSPLSRRELREIDPSFARVVAFNLRRQLAGYGIELRTLRGHGYALSDSSREKLLRICGGTLDGDGAVSHRSEHAR